MSPMCKWDRGTAIVSWCFCTQPDSWEKKITPKLFVLNKMSVALKWIYNFRDLKKKLPNTVQAYVIDLLLHESSRLWHMLLGSWNCTSTHITHLSSFWKEYETPQIFTMVCFWYVSSVYEYFQSEYFIPLDICIMSSENVNQEKKIVCLKMSLFYRFRSCVCELHGQWLLYCGDHVSGCAGNISPYPFGASTCSI